jgi:hypothetical protein
MSNDKVQILTPAGRLVAGDCFKPNDKDNEGNPLIVKSGPNAGQPRVSYYIGLAIPKNSPDWPAVEQQIKEVARQKFPHLHDAQGTCINPAFAFKITDGDSQLPNSKGTKPCDKEGYAGHWILNFSNGFAPKCFKNNGSEPVTSPDEIKKGYYIQVSGDIDGNGSMQQPGVYLNHTMINLVGYGTEIISGPTGKDVFGKTPAALPPGASVTPISTIQPSTPAPSAAIPPAVTPPVTPPASAPAPTPTPGAAIPPPAVTPAHDVYQPPEVMYLDSAGNKWKKADLLAAGWNEQQIETLQKV